MSDNENEDYGDVGREEINRIHNFEEAFDIDKDAAEFVNIFGSEMTSSQISEIIGDRRDETEEVHMARLRYRLRLMVTTMKDYQQIMRGITMGELESMVNAIYADMSKHFPEEFARDYCGCLMNVYSILWSLGD